MVENVDSQPWRCVLEARRARTYTVVAFVCGVTALILSPIAYYAIIRIGSKSHGSHFITPDGVVGGAVLCASALLLVGCILFEIGMHRTKPGLCVMIVARIAVYAYVCSVSIPLFFLWIMLILPMGP
jgi:hypothetical protein